MLPTETRNPKTTHIDEMDTLSMLRVMNEENRVSVDAVETALNEVAKAVEAVAAAFKKGGRLFYVGAGTSGRIAVMDAAECPPTFGVSPDTVNAIIAGGQRTMIRAAEGEEDSATAGREDSLACHLTEKDVVMGISASGGADYVYAALCAAKERGCTTISLSSNSPTLIESAADIAIATPTGAEVITGSTRLKAGNAQKLVLNMISTCAMVKTGKVYENLMINLAPTNKKLRERVIRIVTDILACDREDAIARLEAHDWSIRAVVDAWKAE